MFVQLICDIKLSQFQLNFEENIILSLNKNIGKSFLSGFVMCIWALTLWGWDKWSQYADSIFKFILWNVNWFILIKKNALKYLPHGPIYNKLTLVQIMACHSTGTSHYLNQWWLSLQTNICITWSSWVNAYSGHLWNYSIWHHQSFISAHCVGDLWILISWPTLLP